MADGVFVVVGYCEHDDGPFAVSPASSDRVVAVKALWDAADEHAEALGHLIELDDQPHGIDPGGFFRVTCQECRDTWALDMVVLDDGTAAPGSCERAAGATVNLGARRQIGGRS